MKTLVSRSSFAAAFSILSTLVLACGGGGGGGGGAKKGLGSASCETLCSQLTECASSLGSDVGTLVDDASMTSANCPSQCAALTCTDPSSFVSCSSGMKCSSTGEVQTALKSCSETAGCNGGGGGGGGGGGSASCTTICADLVACAGTLSIDVATLTGDPNMTNSNCASECAKQSCTDLSAFISCADGMTCTSTSDVQNKLHTCSTNAGCGGH
jgi:hypothetical protein